VGVRRSEEVSLWQWCDFNASVLAREGRRLDKVLSEDEADAASNDVDLNGKEA
jgi:hypothetical protein